ncbi:MAG: adenine phosphoribosyltransferase [Pseudomonadota bacterium]
MDVKSIIRTIPDYPKPGIMFRDVTTLMGHPKAFAHVTRLLAEAYKSSGIDKVAGIEARGFVFGAALAQVFEVGFIPVRKKGKLPGDTFSRTYQLEYGEDTLEIHVDAVTPGERVLLIDDLLATGGTALAALELLVEAGAKTAGAAFIVDLPELGGKKRLNEAGAEVLTLIEFEGH